MNGFTWDRILLFYSYSMKEVFNSVIRYVCTIDMSHKQCSIYQLNRGSRAFKRFISTYKSRVIISNHSMAANIKEAV